MNFRRIVFISFFLSPSFPGYSQTVSQDLTDPPRFVQVNQQRAIIENDKILINIRKVPELSGRFNVDQAGMVDLQLIGKVRAAGLRPYEFKKVLAELYGRDYLQDPLIRIDIVDSFRAEDITLFETEVQPDAISLEGGVIADELFSSEDTEDPVLGFAPLEEFKANEPVETFVEVPIAGQAMPTPSTYAPSSGGKKDNVLADTNWTFESDPRAFIQFLNDGKIAGFTGCNNFFANYTFEDNFLNIQFRASTYDACDDVKDGEFQEELESITRYQYSEADKLILLDEDNADVFTLRQGFSSIQGN